MSSADEPAGAITEQKTATILGRIKAAPTRAGKVRELINALDWMRSVSVAFEGSQRGKLTRAQQTFAVTAVGQFLNAVDRNDLALGFQELASALSDLDRGIVRPSVAPAPRAGGPTPLGSNVWRGRAYVAVAVDAMRRADLQMKEIKRIVDPLLELRPLLDPKGKKRAGKHALGDAAEGWREQFNRGAVDNFEAMNAYSNCQTWAAECASPDELMRLANGLLGLASTRANDIERDSG